MGFLPVGVRLPANGAGAGGDGGGGSGGNEAGQETPLFIPVDFCVAYSPPRA